MVDGGARGAETLFLQRGGNKHVILQRQAWKRACQVFGETAVEFGGGVWCCMSRMDKWWA